MRRVTFALPAICGLVIALSALPAGAQGTIIDAPATFVLNAGAFSASPSANFTGVSATLTQDHVFESGWWFRVSGDTQETFFPVPTTQNYVGNTATIDWTDVGGRQLFSAQLVWQVTNTGGPSGYVTGTMTITNIGSLGAPLLIDIFHMLDFDLAGAGSDSATLVTANNHIALTDPSLNTAEYRGLLANAFQVAPFGATDIGAVLSNAVVDNFANTGLPFGPGDFTGGFQWTTVTIPVAGSQAYTVVFSVNTGALPVELSGFSVD